MLYSDSLRKMMQNGLNESFWDGLGVEIGPCANSTQQRFFLGPEKIAVASIKVMDALFGFLARNDAECCKRELLGRSWRRDWAMRNFQLFYRPVK